MNLFKNKEIKKYTFSFDDLNLKSERIIRILGDLNKDTGAFTEDKISRLFSYCSKHAKPEGGLVIFEKPVFYTDSIVIQKKVFKTANITSSSLKGSDYVALFICTAGDLFERYSTELLKKGSYFDAYLLDIIGSETVEATMDIIQDDLETEAAKEKLNITNRYSPGYCGWDVKEQFGLFDLLPENFCRVILTDSAFMEPVKSVSGIIGIGPKVKKRSYTCSDCDLKDCVYRKYD